MEEERNFSKGIKGTAKEIKEWEDAAWNEAETPQEALSEALASTEDYPTP